MDRVNDSGTLEHGRLGKNRNGSQKNRIGAFERTFRSSKGFQGEKLMHCVNCGCEDASKQSRGRIINRRAFLNSQTIVMRDRMAMLEKLANKTPPKTLASERLRVWQAKHDLETLKTQFAAIQNELAILEALEK